MKIEINNTFIPYNHILKQFKIAFNLEILNNIKMLKRCFSEDELEDIKSLSDNIFLVFNNIYIPTQGKIGRYFRMLEYGTPALRQLKIISKSKLRVNKMLGSDKNVM